MSRHIIHILAAAIAVLATSSTAAHDDGRSVLTRTKTTKATYASYGWMISRDENGGNEDGWTSEFHQGDWHRIENRWRHVLANCRTHEMYEYDARTGEIQKGQDVHSSVCGIAEDGEVASIARLDPRAAGPFGHLDTVRVVDARRVRTYQVDRRGTLVRVSWSPRDGSRYPCLDQEPVAILQTLPGDDIFAVSSLARTVTPENYRNRPATLAVTGPAGTRCGS